MIYTADYHEVARLIVNNQSDEPQQIKQVYIKDGKIHVETEERKSRE
jgi:hypothetical protein